MFGLTRENDLIRDLLQDLEITKTVDLGGFCTFI